MNTLYATYMCPVCDEPLNSDTEPVMHEDGTSYGIVLSHYSCNVCSSVHLFEDGGTALSAYNEIMADHLGKQLRNDVKTLLGYFTSANSIPVEKVTLTTNNIKELFGKHFPEHEWTKEPHVDTNRLPQKHV